MSRIYVYVGFGNIVKIPLKLSRWSADSAPIKNGCRLPEEAGTAVDITWDEQGSAGDGKRTAGAFRTFAGNHCKPRTGRTG